MGKVLKLSHNVFKTFEKVGEIELGTSVRVSDPYYGLDSMGVVDLYGIKPGNYLVYLVSIRELLGGFQEYNRVLCQLLVHEDIEVPEDFELISNNIDVDSGICGISDQGFFTKQILTRVVDVGDLLITQIKNPDFTPLMCYEPYETLKENRDSYSSVEYERLKMDCLMAYDGNIRLSTPVLSKYAKVALYEKAVYTFSGYGDGTYDVYGSKTDGQVSAILLDFGL